MAYDDLIRSLCKIGKCTWLATSQRYILKDLKVSLLL